MGLPVSLLHQKKCDLIQIMSYLPLENTESNACLDGFLMQLAGVGDFLGNVAMNSVLTDTIYAEQKDSIARFCFDEKVVRVFPDMLRRSIPGYATIIDMIGILAARFARPNTVLYDLGCSLGAASFAMASMVHKSDCRILAVDNSAAMINQARQLLAQRPAGVQTPSVEFVLRNLEDLQWQVPASMVVLNFTLQFVAMAEREGVLRKAAQALLPGGILVLSEKICFPDAEEEALQQSLYYAFKRNNGYSEMEISQKREALENVLIPETLEAHRERLLRVGFREVHVWYRCFNFCSMLAIR